MQCYICNADNFHLRSDLNQKNKIGICKECGNIQHILPDDYEKKLLDFYRRDYRNRPGTGNLITTTRKLNYIKPFISDFFKDKKNLICGDVGCATGYLLHFLRDAGHKVFGSEYTITFRKFCEHYYKIPLTEELDKKHKYDFISFYHTLEHMMQPDKKLLNHRELLNPKGVLFISVPEWLGSLDDLSGYGQLSIANYFHENHICCFTQKSFRNLLNKCGLEIVKYDTITYGITTFVKSADFKQIESEDWQLVNAQIDRLKNAIELFSKNRFRDAIDAYPNFPDAWIRLIFDHYKKDPSRQLAGFADAEKAIGDNIKLRQARGSWHYQFQRWQEALVDFDWIAQRKLDENILIYLAWCLENIGDHMNAIKMFASARTINPRKWEECEDWICSICSKLPTWDEVAQEQLKTELLKREIEKQKNQKDGKPKMEIIK